MTEIVHHRAADSRETSRERCTQSSSERYARTASCKRRESYSRVASPHTRNIPFSEERNGFQSCARIESDNESADANPLPTYLIVLQISVCVR